MRNSIWVIAIATLLLGAGSGYHFGKNNLTTFSGQVSDSSSYKIAVVDIERIGKEWSQALALRTDLELLQSDFASEVDEKADELEKLQKEMKVYARGTDAWNEKKDAYESLRNQHAVSLDKRKEELILETLVKKQKLWNFVFDTIEKYGERNQYDEILQAAARPEVDTTLSVEEADVSYNMQIGRYNVIHYSDRIDITEQILEILEEAK